jgi:hypothetical protein
MKIQCKKKGATKRQMAKGIYCIGFLFLFNFLLFPKKIFATNETIKAGSFLVNLGITPQTYNNGLKPYGLLYEMLKTYHVPVKWVIKTGKSKDGIDFTHNGINYKGGSFIIPAEYRTSFVNSAIVSWQSQGVVGATSVSDFTADVYATLKFVPNWTLDYDNGAIAVSYFQNAGIPSSAYGGSTVANWKLPSTLGSCDDIFVLPHADPTWSTHNNLYYHNKNLKGSIWVGCHAASVLESLKDPGNTIQMNFLTTTGLVDYHNHSDGSLPYVETNYADDPIMQYMGTMEGATIQGSEQIYLPKLAGAWLGSTKVCVYDATQSDIPSKSPGSAVALAYGRAYGDTARGFVMYEAGHDLDKGTVADRVAAQRAFFNYCFYATRIKTEVLLDYSGIPSAFARGDTIPVYFTYPSGIDTSVYKIKWTNSCGGKFLPNDSQRVVKFVAPITSSVDSCVLSVTVTDQCTRQNFASKFAYIVGKILDVDILNFEGNYSHENAHLKWESINQSPITTFEVERSIDGIHFIKLGNVNAEKSISEYNFDDKNLLPGIYFYRLKITDNTKKFKYSKIILINCGSSSLLSLSVNPNPVSNVSVISLFSVKRQQVNLTIISYDGKPVLQKTQILNAGQNILSLQQLTNLANGYYILSIQTENSFVSNKIIISK